MGAADVVVADKGDPVAQEIRDSARRLLGELARSGADSPLGAMAAARELSAATDAALQESVDRARTAGRSWREIGDVLGTTRQAAFQRFGRPVDPRTGQPMVRDVPPALADQAVAIFVHYAEGRWEETRRDFDENLRERLSADRLAAGWAHTVGMIGGLERMGEPVARQAGDDTVVTVPLHFEAAEAVGCYWAEIESATAERRVLVSYIQARLKGTDMARYDIQTRMIPGRTLMAITRHVHANEAGAFFSDAFARLRAAGPGVEGIAGCPFVVYYGEVSDDSDGPVELCRPVAADPADPDLADPDLQARTEPSHEEVFIRVAMKDMGWLS